MKKLSGMKDYAEMDGKAGNTDSHLQKLLLLISYVASFLWYRKFSNFYIYYMKYLNEA